MYSKQSTGTLCKLYDHVKQFVSPLQHGFFEIAPASHSCYLFLIPLVITWTKIFKLMLSTWALPKLSISLIIKLYFKSSNDMM